MRFSTKSRYGLRLMAELACSTSGRAMPLKEISERQQLSLKYLEQLVTPLVRAGLVKSERGSQGGYRLTKDPRDTTARDQRVPPVRPVRHPALLGRAGRCHQPVSQQRHPGRHRQKHGGGRRRPLRLRKKQGRRRKNILTFAESLSIIVRHSTNAGCIGV